jgi:uncharacterized DUF497 family protein
VTYEWDSSKARRNKRKHRVSFEEACSIFLDPMALTYGDPDHGEGEEREITLGISASVRLLFVSHCLRENRIRIISARKATKNEKDAYEEENSL